MLFWVLRPKVSLAEMSNDSTAADGESCHGGVVSRGSHYHGKTATEAYGLIGAADLTEHLTHRDPRPPTAEMALCTGDPWLRS